MFRPSLSKRDIFLAVVSGLFICVAFPKLEWTAFVWIGFIPFFYALRKKSPKDAFWIGFIMGYVISLGGFYWVIHTLQEFGNFSLAVAIPLFLIFCLFSNIHIAVFAWLLRKLDWKIPPLFWVPVLYTVIEFVFPQIFPWYLGSCLYKKLWLIQTADITGVIGMSYLVILLNVFIYELVRWIRKETDIFPKFSFSVAIFLIIISTLYSLFRLQRLNEALPEAPKIKAALIQTNVGHLEKLKAFKGAYHAVKTAKQINERLVLKATKKASDLDLIILPETAVPGYFTKDRPQNQAEMFHLAYKARVPIAFGGYHRVREPEKKVFNSLFLISPHYQTLGHYDKVRLLVFGEHMPLSQYIPALKKYFPQVSDFAHGTEIEPIALTKELKFAPLICLEGLYPNFVRQFVKKGAHFLLIVTNDSWFGDTSNPFQHRMLHVWRTIENRTPMLRVANTGISTFIDLTGRIRSETPLFEEKILIDEVSIIRERTFYTEYGNLFAMLLIGALFMLYIINSYVKRQGLNDTQ